VSRNIKNLYGFATKRAIFSAFFVAKLFGAISPNTRSKNVIIQVAIHIAILSSIQEVLANSVAITVAKAAVNVLTKLFQIKIVIRSLSLLSFIYLRSFDQNLHSLRKASILCEGRLIRASSVPEKNPESTNNTTNKAIVKGSTW